jgi:hypothetical protein
VIALLAAVALVSSDTASADRLRDTRPPSPLAPVLAVPARRMSLGIAENDTVPRRRRAKAFEYSDDYNTRRGIHKLASYATIPLFVGQYLTGSQLIDKGTDAPAWIKRTHPVLATGVLGLFAVNTVTGLWNAYEGLGDPNGRKWRTAHELLMLAADAGFVRVGLLSRDAKTSGSVRNEHRAWAIGSSATALTAYLMMLKPFRPD